MVSYVDDYVVLYAVFLQRLGYRAMIHIWLCEVVGSGFRNKLCFLVVRCCQSYILLLFSVPIDALVLYIYHLSERVITLAELYLCFD